MTLREDDVGRASSRLVRVAAGDVDAFEELFRDWAPRVAAFYRQRGLPPTEADELAQDVLATVWRQASRYDPAVASPRAWLFAIARNRMIDRYRRERHADPDPGDPMFVVDEGASPEAQVESRRVAFTVTAALERLPPEQRAVLVDGHLAGRSLAEVAAANGLPLGTIKSRARLAMEHLRRVLRGAA